MVVTLPPATYIITLVNMNLVSNWLENIGVRGWFLLAAEGRVATGLGGVRAVVLWKMTGWEGATKKGRVPQTRPVYKNNFAFSQLEPHRAQAVADLAELTTPGGRN